MLKNKTTTLSAAEFREKYTGDKHASGKGSKEKRYIADELSSISEGFIPEYKFLDNRKFRFDWAWPEKRIALEYEGVFSDKSRHTTISGYTKDSEKYNLATINGWRVLRYTAITYKNVTEDVKNLIQMIDNK